MDKYNGNLKIFLWGTGHIANEVLQKYCIFEIYNVIGFIDNDPCKQGKKLLCKNIYSPEILLTDKADKIIILTMKYNEIFRQIREELGLKNIDIEDWRYFQRQLDIRKGILKRYKDTFNAEIREVLKYINQNDLEVFNYPFRERYKCMDISVMYDRNCGMFYVMHYGKRMYFKKSLNTVSAVVDYYKSILVEQDTRSPHRYLDRRFGISHGDIVIDGGVAEGNFALEIIDFISKIYLIETDEEWIEALKETFKNYQDKVFFISKYLTSINDDRYATLDTLIKEPVNFIKMDIEGNEWDALLGAEKLIKKSGKLKCAICAYHTEYDETLIKSLLTQYGLECTVTQGYMWFLSWGRDGNISTKLRRGIVRGTK